jgi:hypothetical protein
MNRIIKRHRTENYRNDREDANEEKRDRRSPVTPHAEKKRQATDMRKKEMEGPRVK